MQKIMFGAMLALGLAGCGGGGGSAGETNQPYTISLRADKSDPCCTAASICSQARANASRAIASAIGFNVGLQ